MRTTVRIDDDLLDAARAVAVQRKTSLGRVLSDWIRKSLTAPGKVQQRKGGFPVFRVPDGARPVTLETVRRAEEDAL